MSDPFPSAVRRPRLRVLANGIPVTGIREAEIESNSYFAADRFSIAIAIGTDPLSTTDYWASQSDLMLDVQMGFIPNDAPEGAAIWVSLVQGAVDTIQIESPSQIVRLDGRDLTAMLIAAHTQETFANQTSSEIVKTIAERHNMAAQVTATSTLVGRYYELEHDRITLDQFSRLTTEWDLLVYLAQHEGFDLFVQGTTLYFQPAQAASVAPDVILRPAPTSSGAANVIELRMERKLALAGDIEVTVKSWNSRQNNVYAQTARGSRGAKSGAPQSYVLVRPNLLPEQALKLAQNWLGTLVQHERIITALMPGELMLTPRSIVGLEGTGTAFDQAYRVETIERRVRFDGGFVQHVCAKNSSP